MEKAGSIATTVGVVVNTILFVLKLVVGISTGSLAVISDAINSLTDVLTSFAVAISFRISRKKADPGHMYGYTRAEPVAGLIVALFAGLAAYEIITAAVSRILNPTDVIFSWLAIGVLAMSVIVKAIMSIYHTKVSEKLRSPSIKAIAIDGRYDSISSAVALIGVIGIKYFPLADSIAAGMVALFILWAGYRIASENMNYLMGGTPDPEMVKAIRNTAKEVRGVIGIGAVRPHYVGNQVHVEIEIYVDEKDTVTLVHKIQEEVRDDIEDLEGIEEAFVHIVPR
ncbi:TPA: cation transporter [archaeon]|nr:cation transporter [Candidatus Undinarchaeales archaeon SRR5007147.bin71]